MHARQMPAEVRTIKRHIEKEPQCRNRDVDLWNAGAARRQMQLKAAYIFRFGRIGRTLEVTCEVLDPLHIVMLGLRRELADRHVFDHAPTQRAYRLFGHGDAPVLSEGCQPLISRQDAPIRHPVSCARAGLAAPYRASGLVLWPIGEESRRRQTSPVTEVLRPWQKAARRPPC